MKGALIGSSLLGGFKFRSLDTPIHRLDPRVKLIISAYLITTVAVYNVAYGGILLISLSAILLEVALLRIGRVSRYVLYTLRGLTPIAVLIFVLQLFTVIDKSLDLALYEASAYTVRFIALISSFSLFFLTTSPEELGLTLTYLRIPYSYAFAFMAAIRFMPIIADELQEIIDAQRSRGVEFEKGGPISTLRRMILIFVPLLVNAIRRSYEMAEAMEVKCFGASKRRVSYRELKAGRVDYIVLLAATVAFFQAMYSRGAGLLQGLP